MTSPAPPVASRRAWLAPEVIQSSAMDCGPASLKCVLDGFGIGVEYGRLREACQTDVDGTSIDMLEDVACELGLHAEQILLPLDHVLLDDAEALPAIAVVQPPHAATHFLVVWKRSGPFVQLMDPATGRRWVLASRLESELYVHEMPVPAEGWREWAGSDAFVRPLDRRLAALGAPASFRTSALQRAAADPTWSSLGALDAAARFVAALVAGRGVATGADATVILERLAGGRFEDARIPPEFWHARPDPGDPERLVVRGAVLVHIQGRRSADAAAETDSDRPKLRPELVAELKRPQERPLAALVRLAREIGLRAPVALAAATCAAGGMVLLQALVLRGLLDVTHSLGISLHRLGAIALAALFALAVLLIELPIAAGIARLGRHLEVRMRRALYEKIPRIGDAYFQSRLVSDMAERAHSIESLRRLPDLAYGLLRMCIQLLFTVGALAWLEPGSAPLAIGLALVAFAVSAASYPVLAEADYRVRSHAGILSRFYLDALLGLTALRAHRGERSLMREHEQATAHWNDAYVALRRTGLWAEGLQAFIAAASTIALLWTHSARAGAQGASLLFAYWALQIPILAQGLALQIRQLPAARSVLLRLLELLSVPEGATSAPEASEPARRPHEAVGREADGSRSVDGPRSGPRKEDAAPSGVGIRMHGVAVHAGGHSVLENVELGVRPGEHVAIVGESGAGKSTLVGLLLGWQRPAAGELFIDDAPLDDRILTLLRRHTAWVDPSVMLYNRRFLDNLSYGTPARGPGELSFALASADLREVLERLPEGLQTTLGEGGAFLSGGEAQRVRLGRALVREGVKLVVLDEAFRGLDRERRRSLLTACRSHWTGATLLCVTHDVSDTLGFERVLVVEGGRVVEDGHPMQLARVGSRYADLLRAERVVHEDLWASPVWRRLHMVSGRLEESRAPERVARPVRASGPAEVGAADVKGAHRRKEGT